MTDSTLFPNLYQILDIAQDADLGDIHAAYEQRLRRIIPDYREGQDIAHNAEARELADAYEILSDLDSRAAYDELIRYPCFSEDQIERLVEQDRPNGYVYVLQEADDKTRYKIGYTNHPARRFRETVIGPFDYEVVAIIWSEDARKLEGELHRLYKEKRPRGEWFELTVKDVVNIRSRADSILPSVSSGISNDDMLFKLQLANRASNPASGLSESLPSIHKTRRLRDFNYVASSSIQKSRRLRDLNYRRHTSTSYAANKRVARSQINMRQWLLFGICAVFACVVYAGSLVGSMLDSAPGVSVRRATSVSAARSTRIPVSTERNSVAVVSTQYVATVDNMPAVVRSCPRRNARCPVIGGLMPGESIRSSKRVSGERIGDNATWLQFRYNGKTAYIHSALVTNTKRRAPQYIVHTSNGGSARIRSCPQSNDDCAVIGGLANGVVIRPQQVVAGQGIAGNFLWFKLRRNGRNAYIHSSLVAPRP